MFGPGARESLESHSEKHESSAGVRDPDTGVFLLSTFSSAVIALDA